MTIYQAILFLHILGAMALFASLAIEWISLARLTAPWETPDVGLWLRIAGRAALASIVFAAVEAVSGAIMMATVRGREGWILVAMAPLGPFIVLAAAVTLRRMSSLRRQWQAAGYRVSSRVRVRLHDPGLLLSLRARSGLVLGITYLMVARPQVPAALLAMMVFGVLGAGSALPSLKARRLARQPAD